MMMLGHEEENSAVDDICRGLSVIASVQEKQKLVTKTGALTIDAGLLPQCMRRWYYEEDRMGAWTEVDKLVKSSFACAWQLVAAYSNLRSEYYDPDVGQVAQSVARPTDDPSRQLTMNTVASMTPPMPIVRNDAQCQTNGLVLINGSPVAILHPDLSIRVGARELHLRQRFTELIQSLQDSMQGINNLAKTYKVDTDMHKRFKGLNKTISSELLLLRTTWTYEHELLYMRSQVRTPGQNHQGGSPSSRTNGFAVGGSQVGLQDCMLIPNALRSDGVHHTQINMGPLVMNSCPTMNNNVALVDPRGIVGVPSGVPLGPSLPTATVSATQPSSSAGWSNGNRERGGSDASNGTLSQTSSIGSGGNPDGRPSASAPAGKRHGNGQ